MNKLNTNNLLSEFHFSELFFEKLHKKVDTISLVSIKNLDVITINNQGLEFSHHLHNAYSEYCSNTNQYEEIIERYVKSSVSLYLKNETINKNRIIPIIKDERFVLELSNTINNYLFEKYNSNLYIFYAEDLDHSISYLNENDFTSLNINFKELRNLAIENLNSIIENIERHGEQNIYMLTAGGDYESSLILLNIWNHENFNVNGDFIIAIPSRDLLFVTGSNEIDEIEKLKNKVDEINKTGDHIVSDKLFILNNSNHFEVWS